MTATIPTSVVLIVSVTSDIGTQLAHHYLARGHVVCGTYRSKLPPSLEGNDRFHSFACDVSSPLCKDAIKQFFTQSGLRWTVFISCVGQLDPIGLFFESDFETWADSVHTNSTAQLRALHASYPFRCTSDSSHAVFFAGGGTNGVFRAYSAYCVGKIALIKMCELLDDEAPELNTFIVGTGWVRTKIHAQTIAAGSRAGINWGTTQAFAADASKGTSYTDIASLIDWGIERGKPVAGGRNFSVVHDAWREGGHALENSLRMDPNKFKLRRHGNS